MKLAIIAWYLVGVEDKPLFDLHMRQIAKHTPIPHTLFAGVDRLPPEFRRTLDEYPHAKSCLAPTPNSRGDLEYSSSLEQLIQLAIEEDASHLVILHLDSFPIRPDWAQVLSTKLGDVNAFATVAYGAYTSCLFFRREFYLNHKPRLQLSEMERASKEYAQFSRQVRHIAHSGAGYLFRAFLDGQRWCALTESGRDMPIGTVYEESIFHLHGATRLQNGAGAWLSADSPLIGILGKTRRGLRSFVPSRVRKSIYHYLGGWLQKVDQPIFERAKKTLVEQPDAYFRAFLEQR